MDDEVDWQTLEERAWAARENAYAPYSQFSVGAAVVTDSGQVFTGGNIENASLGLTICAERVAISGAVQAGCRRFAGIIIVTKMEEPVAPCGACRQFISEFSRDLPVVSVGRDGDRRSWSLSELLPVRFERFS